MDDDGNPPHEKGNVDHSVEYTKGLGQNDHPRRSHDEDVMDGNEFRPNEEAKLEYMQVIEERLKRLENLEEKLLRRIEESQDATMRKAQDEMRALRNEQRQTDEKFDRMEKAHEEMKCLVEQQQADEPKVADRRASFLFGRTAAIASIVGDSSDEDTGISLEEDTFSLMMVAKVKSEAWLLGLVRSRVLNNLLLMPCECMIGIQ